MLQSFKSQKSPLIMLVIISILVIMTLVVATTFFVQPSIELELKKSLTKNFSRLGLSTTVIEVSGRDVTLAGIVNTHLEATQAEESAKKIWGIRKVNNQLVIINRTTE